MFPHVALVAQRMLPGVVIALVGIAMLYIGQDYQVGSMRRIGPGFFPLVIACLLIGVGIFIIIEDLLRPSDKDAINLRSILVVSAAIIAWSLTIDRFGFAISTFLLIFISSLAEKRPRYLHSLFLSIGLASVGYLIFVTGFGLPFTLLRL
jgi:hypothetical protein